MRYLLVLLLLAGCASRVTLIPRGGGERAIGTFSNTSRSMSVMLRGEKYSGSYTVPTTVGVGLTPIASPGGYTTMMPTTTVGAGNQASAVLEGPSGVLRCDFVRERGGGGVCVDSSNAVYDLLVR